MPITWTSEATAALMSGTRRLGVELFTRAVSVVDSLKGWWILNGPVRESSLTLMWKIECCQGTSFATTFDNVRCSGADSSARWSARTRSSLFGFYTDKFWIWTSPSLSSEPWFIINLRKELSWPHPSCRAINISENAMLNTQRSQGFLPMTQCSQGHSVARVLVSRVLRFKVLCSPD